MSVFPHSRLFLGPSRTVVISGAHIQVVDSQNGTLIHSTANLDGAEKDAVVKSGPIHCTAVDGAFTHVATAGDEKKLKVWQIDGLKLLSDRELPKKPTAINFTRDGQTILVSDKFGDVFSYPLHPKPADPSMPLAGSSKRDALTSHENPSDGELILGHVSLLTCFLLSPDEQYIITADRDEHIRVSWYPKGYVIESYCLGHEKFVSAIHIPAFSPSSLVSGGGDPTLKLWDWLSGALVSEIPVLEAIEPYIKVKAARRKWGRNDEEDQDGDRVENNTRRRRKRGRKGRGKGKEQEGGAEAEGTQDVEGPEADAGKREEAILTDVDQDVTADIELREDSADGTDEGQMEDSAAVESDKTVLVIHRIQSVDLGDQGRFLVFNAVGASALFYCTFPVAGAASPPLVHSWDFGCPVTDFVLGANGDVWVLLDPSQGVDVRVNANDKPPLVALLSWAAGVPTDVPEGDAPALLSALKTTCAIRATPAELKTLDLYSALSSMPKNVDPEHGPLRRDLLAEATLDHAADDAQKGKSSQKKELTQRELARLKKKRALAAKLQEQEQGQAQAQDEQTGEVEVERDSKRGRSLATDAVTGATVANVNAMDES